MAARVSWKGLTLTVAGIRNFRDKRGCISWGVERRQIKAVEVDFAFAQLQFVQKRFDQIVQRLFGAHRIYPDGLSSGTGRKSGTNATSLSSSQSKRGTSDAGPLRTLARKYQYRRPTFLPEGVSDGVTGREIESGKACTCSSSPPDHTLFVSSSAPSH